MEIRRSGDQEVSTQSEGLDANANSTNAMAMEHNHNPLDDVEMEIANGEHHRYHQCPGLPYVALADLGSCTHGGAEVSVEFNHEDIEEFFGDNVVMKEWKYFLDGCDEANCELINPDVNHHQYAVGKTDVRVEGYDLAGHMNSCIRTVYVKDMQAPVFDEPEIDLNQEIEIHFPPDSCSVSGATPFHEYEEQAGFSGHATDNCDDTIEIVKKIKNAEGNVIYSSDQHGTEMPSLSGPGSWRMCYVAVDNYAKTLGGPHAFGHNAPYGADQTNYAEHCVDLTISDITPPYDYEMCPDDIYIEIEAHENETVVEWTLPTIMGDNCEGFGELPDAMEQSDPPKYPGMIMPVGSHVVNYAVADASGNVLEDAECSFTVEIKQKAHPVTVVCPGDVHFTTLEDASFAIVTWEEPIATQGGKILSPAHITYPQGVSPGLPFVYGKTEILVHAAGEITGTRVDEHLMYDECIFNVTVADPQRPEVDGRMYRCKDDENSPDFAKPFRVCNGTDLDWHPHPMYVHTHGYDVRGTIPTDLECCESESHVKHECVPVTTPVDVEPLVSYCKPVA